MIKYARINVLIMTSLLHSASFAVTVQWVLHHGYWFLFVAMLIEGPIVTAAAGFAAALGYFDPLFVFILSLLGDLVADILYYAIGYWGRLAFVERWGHKFGLTTERMKRMEQLLQTHAVKTLLALKLTPILPTPGLMLVGATKMDLRKFTIISLLITLPKSLAFMLIGYFFGQQYDKLSRYVTNGTYLIVAAIALIFLINYLWGKFSARVGSKIEKL